MAEVLESDEIPDPVLDSHVGIRKAQRTCSLRSAPRNRVGNL